MKIAAYCRVSTEKDEQLDSLTHQKEFFEEYAQKNGHTLYRVYADEGISGMSLKKRTEFKRLIQDAKYGLFDAVVVKDISRFARNTVDFLQSIRTLKDMGINTVFLTANMTSLGDSEFVLTIFSALAQEESANLSKRVKWGKKINAQKGRVPQRIYGYDRIDNFTLRINPEEAEVVREIYRMYLEEGLGCRKISIALNQKGALTKFGCDWNPRGVRRVLSNPIYCGHYINNKFEIKDYLTGKQVKIPVEEHFHHERPEWAIITPEEFQRTAVNLEQRRQQYLNKTTFRMGRYSNKHVFSTLIKCEECGRSFCRKTYTYVNSHSYWVCPTNYGYTAEKCQNKTHIPEEQLLDVVRTHLAEVISNKEQFIKDLVQEFVKNHKEAQEHEMSNADIEKQVRRLEYKKSKLQDMYANDIIDMEELKQKIEPIKSEIARLGGLLTEHAATQHRTHDAEKVALEYTKTIENFLNLTDITNMDMRKVIDHISVSTDGKVKIFVRNIADLEEICL